MFPNHCSCCKYSTSVKSEFPSNSEMTGKVIKIVDRDIDKLVHDLTEIVQLADEWEEKITKGLDIVVFG